MRVSAAEVTRRRGHAVPAALGLLAAAALLLPAPLAGQARAVGVVAGSLRSTQTRLRAPDSERHDSFLVGAWIDVVTPRSWLSILAEASYGRRGGAYDLGPRLEDVPVDVDYLSVAVLPTLRFGLGPVSLVGYAGPSVDFNLRTETVAELAPAFLDAAPQVLSVAAGGGVEARRGRLSLRLEARVHQQLADAFRGDAEDLKHRSTEILVRVGVRPVP